MRLFRIVVVLLSTIAAPVVAGEPALAGQWQPSQAPERTDVFVSGTDGYHTYRIPALLVSKKGPLLAFCEGRKTGRDDSGDIDLLLKRSQDRGKTWGRRRVVWDEKDNTCGNPCPVVDQDTGTIWLLMTHNLGVDREQQIVDQTGKGTRTVWVTSSTDDGLTWTEPRNITDAAKKPDWTWYATGPGAGIQLRRDPHKGRLIVPCDHIEAESHKYYSHVIYSDDHGRTWQLGGTSPVDRLNECQVIELTDGRLMLNSRNYDRRQKQRAVCFSDDGGLTWSGFRHDATLIDPICQASLIRYRSADAPGAPLVLFSNPASENERIRMTVRLSCDDGRSWPLSTQLHAGPAAYSCLAPLPDGTIGCLYESGDKHPYEKIAYARFSLEWLADSTPGKHTAVAATPHFTDWWLKRHESLNARARRGEADLIFLGDSITHAWEVAGAEVWEKYYGDRKAVNMGIGGDRTQHVLWRLDHGNIEGVSPKVVVLMIGTNNSNGDEHTAEEIADGIVAIVEKLRAKLPRTKVLLLAIFPRGEGPGPQREKNAQASRLAAKIADGMMIHYLDIGERFLGPDQTLSRAIMPDLLHLSPAGYEIWAESIDPKLVELLGEDP